MTLRLVHTGRGPLRDVVLVHYLGTYADPAVVAAAPDACIVNDTQTPTVRYTHLGAGGILSLRDAVAWAVSKAGPFTPSRLIVCGFSAGGQAVRTLLMDAAHGGAAPDAVVVADGTHASRPPQEWQLSAWRGYIEGAKAGAKVAILSHTQILPPTYLGTRDTLRLLTGWPLEVAGPVDAPAVRRDGGLVVESYAGARAHDHELQAQVVFPRLLGRAMKMLSDTASPEAPVPSEPTHPTGAPEPLGVRALRLSVAELDAGVVEEPLGSNTGPRIREYLAGCMRDGKRVGLTAGEWCAAGCSWAAFTAANGDGQKPPHGWRIAVRELWSDAHDAGAARDASAVRSGAYRPRVGDLAILTRGGPASGKGHVGRLESEPDRDGAYRTIDANHGVSWGRVARNLGDGDLVGFIEYPRGRADGEP